MRTLSVCSGIAAPEATGIFEPVMQCEIDSFCRDILQFHYPEVTVQLDLNDRAWWSDLNGENIEVLIGGTPCQSFSVAGKRYGLDDDRGNLTLTFLDLAEHVFPEYVVWENVPGVMKGRMNLVFDEVINRLKRIGYFVETCIIDAQNFGVPQHRPRVFVVGSPAGIDLHEALFVKRQSSVADILEESPSKKYDISARAAAGVLRRRDKHASRPMSPVLREALERVAANMEIGEGQLYLPTMSNGAEVSNAVTACGNGFAKAGVRSWGGDPLLLTSTASTLTATNAGRVTSRYGLDDLVVQAAIAPTVTSRAQGFKDGSVHAKSVAPYIVKNRRLRRFTPLEVERLQGFPDQWTAQGVSGPMSDTRRYQMLGNSMAVPVVEWIGKRIEKVHERRDS